MRALFTQLSLLVGFLTAYNLNTGILPLNMAILAGVLVGFAVYSVLLLGDFTIHRMLEEKVGKLTSVQFLNEDEGSDWLEDCVSDGDTSDSGPEALAA